MSTSIDYFYSHLSPYAYLGHAFFEELANKHNVAVNYKPVNLMAVFDKTGGLPLGKRDPARLAYRIIELKRWRDERNIDLNINPKHMPTNPMAVDCAAISIAETGGNVGLFSALAFKAFWTDDRNIGDEETIASLIQEAGSNPTEILDLASRAADIYEKNTQEAIAHGVVGSPGYLLNGEPFWGQDRLEMLEGALITGRAAYTTDV